MTDKEYKLLKKIQTRRITRTEDLWPWEFKTFYSLYDKGYVALKTRDRAEDLENSKVMLDKDTGGKAYDAEQNVKPELEPGPTRVFTASFVRRSFRAFFFGVFASIATRLLLAICHYLLILFVPG